MGTSHTIESVNGSVHLDSCMRLKIDGLSMEEANQCARVIDDVFDRLSNGDYEQFPAKWSKDQIKIITGCADAREAYDAYKRAFPNSLRSFDSVRNKLEKLKGSKKVGEWPAKVPGVVESKTPELPTLEEIDAEIEEIENALNQPSPSGRGYVWTDPEKVFIEMHPDLDTVVEAYREAFPTSLRNDTGIIMRWKSEHPSSSKKGTISTSIAPKQTGEEVTLSEDDDDLYPKIHEPVNSHPPFKIGDKVQYNGTAQINTGDGFGYVRNVSKDHVLVSFKEGAPVWIEDLEHLEKIEE